MTEWKEYKLGDYIDIEHGYAFTGKLITEEETNLILVTPGNFNIGGGFKDSKLKYYKGINFPEKYIFNKDDLIVTMTDLSQETDTLGYSAKVPSIKNKKLLHNQRIGLIKFRNNNLHKDYLYWLMRTRAYQGFIVGSASGTSIMHTSPSRIKEYKFYCPPFPEQKPIAEVLTSLDDKIDLLNRQNKTLEALAQTYFRQWFIEEASNDWEEKGLDDIADFLNGLPLQKYPYKIGIPLYVIKIKELNNGFSKNTDICSSNVPHKYIVNFGDIIFSWSGSLIVDIWKNGKGALNQHLFKVTSNNYPKWFFYYWIKHHIVEFRIIAEAKATTMGHIQRGDLAKANVFVPSKTELINMNTIMDPLIKKIEINNQQIQTLQKLRDTLLPKLISGEVKIIK